MILDVSILGRRTLAASYKSKYTLTSQPSSSPMCLPKRNENMSTKTLYKNVHSSSVRNSSKLERAQVFISRRIDKQTGMPAQWNTTQLRNVLRPYKTWMMLSVVAHAFDSSSWQFEASLVHIGISRTARATHKTMYFKNKQKPS